MDGFPTLERAKAHLDALEVEAAGYDERLKRLAAGGTGRLDKKTLDARAADARTEIARFKKALGVEGKPAAGGRHAAVRDAADESAEAAAS